MSNSLIDQQEPQSDLEKHLSPLELNDFLRKMHDKLHKKIAALRIRKTLYIR